MNLTDIRREAYAIAKEHAWWDETTTFGDRIERIHGALSEAGKASRAPAFRGDLGWRYVPVLDDEDTDRIVGNKPVGVAAELADAVILAAGVAEHYGVEVAALRVGMNGPYFDSFEDYITNAHGYLTAAYYVYRGGLQGHYPADEWRLKIAWLVMLITVIAERYGIDLDAAIQAKLEYYRTRPDRQGGKTL